MPEYKTLGIPFIKDPTRALQADMEFITYHNEDEVFRFFDEEIPPELSEIMKEKNYPIFDMTGIDTDEHEYHTQKTFTKKYHSYEGWKIASITHAITMEELRFEDMLKTLDENDKISFLHQGERIFISKGDDGYSLNCHPVSAKIEATTRSCDLLQEYEDNINIADGGICTGSTKDALEQIVH